MPNPTLNQITRNAVLLKDRYTAVTERMSRPDRNPDLFADRLQNMSINVVADQRCSILRLEDPSNLTIANMFLDELQHFGSTSTSRGAGQWNARQILHDRRRDFLDDRQRIAPERSDKKGTAVRKTSISPTDVPRIAHGIVPTLVPRLS
jgi:hypothetical protein